MSIVDFYVNMFMIVNLPVLWLFHTHGIFGHLLPVANKVLQIGKPHFFHMPGFRLLNSVGSPTLVIKLCLQKHIFTFLTSSVNYQ